MRVASACRGKGQRHTPRARHTHRRRHGPGGRESAQCAGAARAPRERGADAPERRRPRPSAARAPRSRRVPMPIASRARGPGAWPPSPASTSARGARGAVSAHADAQARQGSARSSTPCAQPGGCRAQAGAVVQTVALTRARSSVSISRSISTHANTSGCRLVLAPNISWPANTRVNTGAFSA